MISIISDYSQGHWEALSLVDFTLKSDNLDYSRDEEMRHSRGLSDTQELVKRLKENEGNIMLDNEELESALEVANKTALELKENLEFVLNREEELKLEYEDVRGKYKIIKKFFD